MIVSVTVPNVFMAPGVIPPILRAFPSCTYASLPREVSFTTLTVAPLSSIKSMCDSCPSGTAKRMTVGVSSSASCFILVCSVQHMRSLSISLAASPHWSLAVGSGPPPGSDWGGPPLSLNAQSKNFVGQLVSHFIWGRVVIPVWPR